MSEPKYKERTRTDLIVVHCSATPSTRDIGAREINRWHIAQGWLGIGYHYVIRRDGTIETGRPYNTIGSHAQGVNDRSIGICLVGGTHADDPKKAENNFTQSQFDALLGLLKRLALLYPTAQVLGHRDIPGVRKECPCFDVKSWLANVTQTSIS